MTGENEIDQVIANIAAGIPPDQIDLNLGKIDLNRIGTHGRTPLMVAAAEGALLWVDTLVSNGATVRQAGRNRLTALHEAAANDNAEVASRLLSLGAEIDAPSVDDATPLMCAAAWGGLGTAKCLLEHNADQSKADKTGSTASDIAREKGEYQTAMLIDTFLKPSGEE